MPPTASELRRLTTAHRNAQYRRAAKTAAIIAAYYRAKVAVQDPASVEAWILLALPLILRDHDESARLGADFGNLMRRLEMPDLRDGFSFEPVRSINAQQVKSSLLTVGPSHHVKEVTKIGLLDEPPVMKKAMLEDARQMAAKKIAASTLRHVQNGGRDTIEGGSKIGDRKDPVALGYVRVTRDKPCYFCAMLASRGLEYGTYGEDSFDQSDARFQGPGTAKVHDSCHCVLKPVYRRDDELLLGNQHFTDMWYDLSGEGDADALTNFRRNYEKQAA